MLKDNYTKTGVLFGAFLLANLVLTCLWHFIDGLELKGMLLGLVKVEFPQKKTANQETCMAPDPLTL